MKRFQVYRSTNVDSNVVAEYDKLAEAKAYCNDAVKGYEYAGVDCPDYSKNTSFAYDVYDGSPFNDDSSTGLNDPVFMTGWYYND